MSAKSFEQTLIVGPFQCNCRILTCAKTGHAVLVDPGDEAPRILEALRGIQAPNGLPVQVKYLLHTHGHLDHIAATKEVKESLAEQGPKIALHRDDDELYRQLRMQARLFSLNYGDPLPVDHYLEDGEELKVGEMKFTIVHTPGHSPGSVCFRLHESSAAGASESLYSGDTLFRESVGRTDLWGGDEEKMYKSIRTRILVLDDATRVCPGHGPETTIGFERKNNPYLL